jgi:Tripartite tricarboxylate transporter TctB family
MAQLSGTPETTSDSGADRPRRSRHSDVWVAAAIFLFCAVIFAVTMTFDEIPASLAQGMQAAAFPQLVICVLVVLTGLMVWISRNHADPVREKLPGIFYQTGLFVLAFMAVLHVAGLMVATPFAVIGMGRLWGERRWWLMIVVGVCLAVGLRILFVNGFGVQLPRGLIVERFW